MATHSDPTDAHAAGTPGDDEIARIAAQVLGAIPFPALVLEVPAERIVASSTAAARLLEPTGADVDGHLLREFTTDHPASGADIHAGARLDGAETLRVLRRTGTPDLPVRLWIRSFDGQPTSDFVVAVIVVDKSAGLEEPYPAGTSAGQPRERPDAPAVVGLVDADLLVERISSDAESLFGAPLADLLMQSLPDMVAPEDKARCLTAFEESSATHNGITLDVHISTGADHSPVRCELLLLPMHPAPSCVFVIMPISAAEVGGNDPGLLSTSLLRLRRSAEMAHLAHGAFVGVADRARLGLDRLTTREFEVVTRLLDGQRPPAIARSLFLSQSTVRNHLGSVFAKYGVSSQQELLDLLRTA